MYRLINGIEFRFTWFLKTMLVPIKLNVPAVFRYPGTPVFYNWWYTPG